MFAARISFAHLSVPYNKLLSRPATSRHTASPQEHLDVGVGELRLFQVLSLSTISAAVFTGAPMPIPGTRLETGTNSLGRDLGNAADRATVVTASGRTLPYRWSHRSGKD
jgi:hypothetical protein